SLEPQGQEPDLVMLRLKAAATAALPGRLRETVEKLTSQHERFLKACVQQVCADLEAAACLKIGAFRHSPDFRSVSWGDIDFKFTAKQAAIVQVLHGAWANGTPDVGGETLLDKVGSETKQLRDLFKDRPAWGTMIVPGKTKGSFRIALPDKKFDEQKLPLPK